MATPSRLLGLALLLTVPALAQDDAPPAQSPPPVQSPPVQSPPVQRSGGGADPSDDAFQMGSPPALPEGKTEEEIWPAATAEGWRKPVLVQWQRSFDDALRVARAENRPLLVAVNMDGEIASEHFAGVRYREAETAAMMSRYSCVIASVYRHTPRDYDEEGRRVECPRFGTVTCGEHIDAERELYAKYFDGKRISPRHIVLDLEGNETYDVYYSWDTQTVFTTFAKGVEGWPEPNERRERAIPDLVKSADVADREAVEKAYRGGDRDARRAILEALLQEHVVDQTELLREAIFGFDQELAGLARKALAQCDTDPALDLMAEALKAPLEGGERAELLGAVERLAESSPRARTLAALHSGLATTSRLVASELALDPALEYEAASSRHVDLQARAEAAEARPEEPGALLDLAQGLALRAGEPGERRYASLLLQDARDAVRAAEERGASGARLLATHALIADAAGSRGEARQVALAAVEAGALLADTVPALDPAARLRLLRLFGDARQRAIRDAYRTGGKWPAEWLSDVNAAYAEIAVAPATDVQTLVEYHDFLRWVGATPRADAVLEDALGRFPDSPVLHDRLRGRLLWQGGPDALERAYDERLQREAASGGETQLGWYAGYAALVAAEHHRRRGQDDPALAAYARGIARFQDWAARHPEGRDDALHFAALGWAGRARVELERGELEAAGRSLATAFETRPESAATPDGLNLTPIQTAKMLLARLEEAGEAAGAARVQAALDTLDPQLLEPPPSERAVAPGRGRGPGGGGGR